MLLLIICLVVQGLLVSVHGAAQAMVMDAPEGYRTLVICTGTGTHQITLNEDGDLIEDQELPQQSVYCPMCLAAQVDIGLPEIVLTVRSLITGYDYNVDHINIRAFDRRPDNLHCLDPPLKA